MSYDQSLTNFSADGRIPQIEYANEAVNRGLTSVAVRGKVRTSTIRPPLADCALSLALILPLSLGQIEHLRMSECECVPRRDNSSRFKRGERSSDRFELPSPPSCCSDLPAAALPQKRILTI